MAWATAGDVPSSVKIAGTPAARIVSASVASSAADGPRPRRHARDQRPDQPEAVALGEVAERLVAGHQRPALRRDAGEDPRQRVVERSESPVKVGRPVGHVESQVGADLGGECGDHVAHGQGVRPEVGVGRPDRLVGIGRVRPLARADVPDLDVIGGDEPADARLLRLVEGVRQPAFQVRGRSRPAGRHG